MVQMHSQIGLYWKILFTGHLIISFGGEIAGVYYKKKTKVSNWHGINSAVKPKLSI